MSELKKSLQEFLGDTHRCLSIIALVSVALYINSLGGDFVWHDKFFIEDKGGIVESWKEIPRVFISGWYSFKTHLSPTRKNIYYRPLIALSFSIDYALWKLRPFGYHLTNILWHALNGFLVFFIFNSILERKSMALFTSLFFVTHPVNTACVANITNRVDIICMFFILAAWYLFIKDLNEGPGSFTRPLIPSEARDLKDPSALRPQDEPSTNTKNSPRAHLNTANAGLKRRYFLGSAIAFLLALFSKETALILPLLLILHIVCLSGKKSPAIYKRLMLYIFFFSMIVGFYLALRTMATGTFDAKRYFLQDNIFALIFTMINVIRDYICLLFWPLNLTTSDAFPISKSLFEGPTFISLILVMSIISGGIIAFKHDRKLTFAVFWFFITLLPVSNIIPILYLRADNFLYAPSLGFSLFLTIAIVKTSEIPRLKWADLISSFMAIAILLFYSTLVINRNRDWKDKITLFTKTTKTDPYCREAHAWLGFTYHEKGLYNEAFSEYQKAIQGNPKYYSFLNPVHVFENLGIIYYNRELYDEAEASYQKALFYEPKDAKIHLDLGSVYFKKGRYDKAIGEFELALNLNPSLTDAHYNLGVAYFKLGLYTDAIKEYNQVLKLSPHDVETHYNIGLVYEKTGKLDRAIAEFKIALSLNPDHPPIKESLQRVEDLIKTE